MGQKVNPISLRVGITRTWNSNWFVANKSTYKLFLHEDLKIRTFIKKVEAAIAGGDREGARAALRMAEPEIMRGSGRVMHRNTAARRVAGLARRIKAMQT